MRKRLTGVMAIAMLLIVGLIAPVSADDGYVAEWDGRGTDSEACNKLGDGPRTEDGWIHWVFSTKGSSTEATLAVGSDSYSRSAPLNANTWHFFTPYDSGVLARNVSVSISFDDEPGRGGGLVISDYCEGVSNEITQTVQFNKSWIGDPFDGSSLDVTFEVDVDGTVGTYNDGDVITYEDGYELLDENVSGFPDDECSWSQYELLASSSIDTDGNTAARYTVVNDVTCDDEIETIIIDRIIEREVIVEVEVPGETIIVEVEVLPEVIEAEPEVEPVVVAPEVVEVRGVTAVRAVPTGIDAGTGGYLPSSTPTAVLLLLMLGGLALTGGATASLVRRRG